MSVSGFTDRIFPATRAPRRYRPWLILWATLLLSVTSARANTIVWTGGASADWNNTANWSPQAVPGAADDIQLGLIPFLNQPMISGVFQCASLTLGSRQPITLTISSGASLTVSGAITLSHSPDNLAPVASITGAGTLTCATLMVGNTTFSDVVLTKTTLLTLSLANFNVTGDVVVNSATIFLLSGGLAHNNGLLLVQGGQLQVSGRIKLTNLIPYDLTNLPSLPSAVLKADASSGQTPRLKLLDSLSAQISNPAGDTLDYYYFNPAGSGNATVEYGGGNQVIHTGATRGVDTHPADYQNLVISGTGTKRTESASGDTLTVGGYLQAGSGTLDMQINRALLSVGGDFTNNATVKLSPAIFSGAHFTNTGLLQTTTDTIRFTGGSQQLNDNTASGTTIVHAKFSTATKTISTGTYIIPGNGSWTVADDSTQMAISPNALLVFHADSSGQPSLTFVSQSPASLLMTGNNRSLAAGSNLMVKKSTPKTAAGSRAGGNRGNQGLISSVIRANSTPTAPAGGSPVVQPAQTVIALQAAGSGTSSPTLIFRLSALKSGAGVTADSRAPRQAGGIELYSTLAGGQPLSSRHVAYPLKTVTLPVYVTASKTGYYTLTFSGIASLPPDYSIRLNDLTMHRLTDLRKVAGYTFRVDQNKPGNAGNRFELIIAKQP